MKYAAILLALLPAALALPFTIPAAAKAEVKRAENANGLFPVRYSNDVAKDSEKRAENTGFPVRYRKDLINDPQKRAQTPGLFAVSYKKDVIDSTNPAKKLEKREAVAPEGLFAVSYRKDIIPSLE
ncbi:uncharacterized protein N0V89_008034 [Didymosphaeria variabile]|uniref:Uncharacterized protein n=1 Tax=Didymosphaeria variabile TaxID=1932322 RepID=A0A9W8XF02_9PLEO|nr:uncharacterized protein N0V89_008034 [Didymosphaeria variabile]KAJ4349419.1 hypothetical protein N0V89_008034 [Didymosphaeria variabile]